MITRALDQVTFPFEDAAFLAGITPTQLRNMLNRDRLLPPESRPGSGIAWAFDLGEIFNVAAVEALRATFGFSTADAVALVRSYSLFGAFLEDRPLIVSQSAESDARRCEIHIAPWPVWDEMRPRAAARWPEETRAFEWRLADLRKRQRAGHED